MSIYGATIYRVIRMRISNLQKILSYTLQKVDFRLKIAELSPNKASGRIKDMLMNCLKFSFAAVCLGILLSLSSTIALSQTINRRNNLSNRSQHDPNLGRRATTNRSIAAGDARIIQCSRRALARIIHRGFNDQPKGASPRLWSQ